MDFQEERLQGPHYSLHRREGRTLREAHADVGPTAAGFSEAQVERSPPASEEFERRTVWLPSTTMA